MYAMKWNKISGRFAAAMMAGAMTVSMLGVTAFAEESTETSTLTKQVVKDANIYAPATDFVFTIEGVGEQTGVQDASGNTLSSPAGGLVFSKTKTTTASISSSPLDSDIDVTTLTVGTLDVEASASAFSTPGVYRYKITETGGSYEGIDYDKDERYVDVFIYKEGNPKVLFVSADGSAKADGIVCNKYGKGNTPDTDLYDLTLTKHVTGNQSVPGKKFTFTITVDGAAGEKYLVKYGTGASAVKKTLVSDDTNGVTVELSDGESAVIYGLSKTDAYTITENSYENEGYKTYIASADGTGTLAPAGYVESNRRSTAAGNYEAVEEGTLNDKAVHVYNDKTVTTPTGIAVAVAPYMLMVVAAGAFAVLFLRRRKSNF